VPDSPLQGVTTAEIRAWLEIALNSGHFRRRKALAKLLEYLVSKAESYSARDFNPDEIASQVFGDNVKDGARLLAVNAHRLRKTLEAYGRSLHPSTSFVVSLPRGEYRLVFRSNSFSDSGDPVDEVQSPRIPQTAFFNFLLALTRDMPEEEQHRRLSAWITTSSRFADLQMRRTKTVASLQAALVSGGHDLSFWDMSALTKELGIHPILLDPLSARPVSGDCLRLQLPMRHHSGYRLPLTTRDPDGPAAIGSFVMAGRPYARGYGEHVQYWVADHRLADTDAAFVSLVLEPRGATDDHNHPGDGLIFVLAGTVRVYLRNSGVEFDLTTNCYVHFYSEQSHSLRNLLTDTAHVFIIRFYQFQTAPDSNANRPPTRQAMNRILQQEISLIGADVIKLRPSEEALSDSTRGDEPADTAHIQQREARTRKVLRDTAGWLLAPIAEHPVDYSIPTRVLNPLGLTRFLRRLEPEPDFTDSFIEAIGGSRRMPDEAIKEWLWRVETMQSEVSRDFLERVSKTYGITDLPLLFEFLFPCFRREVVVKRAEQGLMHADWVNMADVTGPREQGSSEGAAIYEVPRRSLACSDISITWLTLDPDRSTPWNHHVGCECVLALEGSVCVEFANQPEVACHLSALSQVAHFKSARRHRIRNTTQRRAQALLIRFYGERVEPSQSGTVVPKPRRASAPASSIDEDRF
jgi:quercetin dioxygenase-like cupin family protein